MKKWSWLLIIGLVCLVILPDFLATGSPYTLHTQAVLQPPNFYHQPVKWLGQGYPYRFLGIITTHRHLLVSANNQPLLLLGSDRFGRDVYSRLIFALRLSIITALITTIITSTVALLLAMLLFFVPTFFQQLIMTIGELLNVFPKILLWMIFGSLIAHHWPPYPRYVLTVMLIALCSWPQPMRWLYGLMTHIMQQDFVRIAPSFGANKTDIFGRHIWPHLRPVWLYSSIVAWPHWLLAETTASFLGFGLHEPQISLGILLQDLKLFATLSTYPWLLAPIIATCLFVFLLFALARFWPVPPVAL